MLGSAQQAATALSAAVAAVAAAYLARLTISVPDQHAVAWWLGKPAGYRRWVCTLTVAVPLGALAGYAAGWTGVLPAFLLLALIAAPLVVIDIEHNRLPNRLVYAALIGELALLAVAGVVFSDWHAYVRGLEAALGVFVALYLLAFAVPSGLGLGDVKLATVLAAALGWVGWRPVYLGIALAFLLSGVAAAVLLVTRRASLRSAIPFGPMLILATFVVLAVPTEVRP